MIGFLKGKVLMKNDVVVLDVGGIGFEINTTQATKMELDVGEECSLFTTVRYVRDDLPQIYGFKRVIEKEIFELLVSVSGIGPKVAMSVLDAFGIGEIVQIIEGKDVARLCMVGGVGKKGAERIIIDLKDKIKKISGIPEVSIKQTFERDAVDALVALGFPNFSARKAVEDVLRENPSLKTAEEIIKVALERLSKK